MRSQRARLSRSYSIDSGGRIPLRSWVEHASGQDEDWRPRKAPPATEEHYKLIESDYAQAELRTMLWLAEDSSEGCSTGMTVGHAPWNHDALSRQTTTAKLIADFSEELRMQFAIYVGKRLDDEALEHIKAEVLKALPELQPHERILVEQDPEHPDIIKVRTSLPVLETTEVEGDGE